MGQKICFFLFFIILYFLIVRPTWAFSPFVKYQFNPLNVSANYPNWNELGKYQPSVLYENGLYKMWYASYTGSHTTGAGFKIAYATSTDGLNWTGQNLLDVYPGYDNHDPAILRTPNGYRLFFVRSTNGGSQNFTIYSIDSSDGINFDPNSRKLVIQPTGSLESVGASSPSVIFKNGTYYLFYLCWGNQGFRVCMADSTDGINWNRCPNNPVVNQASDGPNIFVRNGKNYLFFQSPLGFQQADSVNQLSCSMTWNNFHVVLTNGPGTYDLVSMISPHLIELDNKLYLYYSGLGSVWTIDLAVSDLSLLKEPIVFVPGLLGSWNKEAILHNQNVSYKSWGSNPMVNEYKGITETLANLGYQENKDFYFFNYDWRKKLDDISQDLNGFIQQDVLPNSDLSTVDLVGHSLGGLVSRIYGQKYGLQNLQKIITVGSPHQGTALTYKAVEGGEFDKNDAFQWLTQKIILQLYKNGVKTDRQTVNEKLPVLKDLLPSYNFLFDQNNSEISINAMQIKNDTLLYYNPTISDIFSALQTIAGEKGQTLSGYVVGQRSTIDILLDLYPDGRPVGEKNEIGDYVITGNSASQESDSQTLNLDHGELVYKSDGIKPVLNSLQILYQDAQIIEGKATKIFPSLIFLILSPATIEVEFNGQTYPEQDGMVFIENAQAGNYLLKVIGTGLGPYKVIIGQVGNKKDVWSEIDAQISLIPPNSQTDTYSISFDPNAPLDYPINQNEVPSLFDLLISNLTQINAALGNRSLDQAINYLLQAKQDYLTSDGDSLRRRLIAVHREIFHSLSQLTDDSQLLAALVQLENLYDRSLQAFSPKPSSTFLQNELQRYNDSALRQEKSLLRQKERGQDVIEQTNLLLLAKDKLEKAKLALQKQNLDYAEILLKSVKELMRE